MAWDFSKRRASRWCLWSDANGSRCGEGNTDQDGLCELHEGLPTTNLTDKARHHADEAIRLRWSGGLQHRDRAEGHAYAARAAAREVQTQRRERAADRAEKRVVKLQGEIAGGGRPALGKATLAVLEQLAAWHGLTSAVAHDILGAASWQESDTPRREDVRRALARNAAAHDGALVRLLLDDVAPSVAAHAASSPMLTVDLLDVVDANGGLAGVAGHHDPEMLRELVDRLLPASSYDQLGHARTRLAANGNAPDDVLRRLADGGAVGVVIALLGNPNLPDDLLDHIDATDRRVTVRRALDERDT